MRKNYKLKLPIESETIEELKKEANTQMISLSELCRRKLRKNNQLDRIEEMLSTALRKDLKKSYNVSS